MKKYLVIGGGVIAVAAAGWSGLWFMGKSQIEDRVNAEVQALDAQGWTLTWGDQEITGFPVGYSMSLTDVSVTNRTNGMLIKLGDVVASGDGSNPDRIVTALPPEVQINIPTKADLLAVNPDLPKTITITATSQDLSIAAEGLDPLTRTVDLSANGMAVTVDQDDFPWKIKTAADGVSISIKARPEGHLMVFNAARHVTTFENSEDPTQPLLKFDYAGPSITLEAAAHSVQDFMTQWAGQSKDLLSGTFLGTGQEIVISVVEPSLSAEAQVMTYKAGASSGLFAVSEGEVTYQAEDREVDLQVYLPAITNSALKTIKTKTEAYQRNLKAPLSAETPKDSTLRLSLIGVAPDDAFWAAVDPDKALDRGTSSLLADLQGTIKYVPSGPSGLPLEFSNVTIDELRLETLGASAKLAGDVEIIQPIALPYGELKIDVTGAQALIKALSQAGLIDFQSRQMAEAVLQVYSKPGEGEDTWTTDVVMDHEGVKVNGLKMPER